VSSHGPPPAGRFRVIRCGAGLGERGWLRDCGGLSALINELGAAVPLGPSGVRLYDAWQAGGAPAESSEDLPWAALRALITGLPGRVPWPATPPGISCATLTHVDLTLSASGPAFGARSLWDLGLPLLTLHAQSDCVDALAAFVSDASSAGFSLGLRVATPNDLDAGRLRALHDAGLSWLLVPWVSRDRAIHDALRGSGDQRAATALMAAARERGIAVEVEMPLLEATSRGVEASFEHLAGLSIRAVVVWPIVGGRDAPGAGQAGAEAGSLPRSLLVDLALRLEELAYAGSAPFPRLAPASVLDESRSLSDLVRSGPRLTRSDGVAVGASGVWARAEAPSGDTLAVCPSCPRLGLCRVNPPCRMALDASS
jgi:hypothetical protein